MISNDRAQRSAEAREQRQWRILWINWHLGGSHWVHSDPSDINLKAQHSCLECRKFRNVHWPQRKRPHG